jgi:hypothetical protein
LTADQVGKIYRDIEQKRATTRYLHTPPLLVEEVAEVACHSREGGNPGAWMPDKSLRT